MSFEEVLYGVTTIHTKSKISYGVHICYNLSNTNKLNKEDNIYKNTHTKDETADILYEIIIFSIYI